MLLFKATPYRMDWAELNEQDHLIRIGKILPEQPFPADLFDAVEEAEEAVYLLENCGPEFSEAVTELAPGMLPVLQDLQKFAPYENTLLMNTVFQMVTMRPDMRHVLLCNTAYFRHLPQTARGYALPKELRYPEIQRYGSDGIYHQYGAQLIRAAFPDHCDRLITVFLDEFSASVAVIQRGIAVECSSGFSKLEGIPGLTSVGSIDPSLPLLLCEDGMSVDQALQVLTLQSGFQALDPQLERLDLLIQNNMPEGHQKSRERLQYQLLKQIGSGMAVLNGIQQILFLTTSIEPTHHFLLGIAKILIPRGVDCLKSPFPLGNGLLQITNSTSKIQIHTLQISPWTVLANMARVV